MEENKNEEVKKEEVKNETEKVEAKTDSTIENFKKGTKDTLNKAKEQMKNINFKEEAVASKNIIERLIKQPLEVIKEVSQKENDGLFKTSLIIAAVWVVVILIGRILYYATLEYVDFEFLPTLKAVIAPILSLIVTAGAVYFLNQKKPIKNIVTATIIAKIPAMFTSVFALLTYIATQSSYITTPVNAILRAIALVLEYFAIKYLLDEDDDKAFMSFIKVKGIYYAVYFVLSFLGIHI